MAYQSHGTDHRRFQGLGVQSIETAVSRCSIVVESVKVFAASDGENDEAGVGGGRMRRRDMEIIGSESPASPPSQIHICNVEQGSTPGGDVIDMVHAAVLICPSGKTVGLRSAACRVQASDLVGF